MNVFTKTRAYHAGSFLLHSSPATSTEGIASTGPLPEALPYDTGTPRDVVITNEIVLGEKRLTLRSPLRGRLFLDEDVWVCQHQDMRVVGHGSSRIEALTGFIRDFMVAYDGLADAPDETLSVDAQMAKRELNRIVGRATSVRDTWLTSLAEPFGDPDVFCDGATEMVEVAV